MSTGPSGPAEIMLENDVVGIEEEETRDVTNIENTKVLLQGSGDLSGQQLNNYLFNNSNTTTNLFEMGSSSLLVEQGVRPGGLFAAGDRFIPYRPEET